MYLIRRGWYYLTRNQPIQVGDKTITFRQRIHSEDPDFKKIDIKYFADGYLIYEAYLPHGTENQYFDFNPAPKPVAETPVTEVPEVVEAPVEPIEAPVEPIEAPKKGKKKKSDEEKS